MAVIDADTHVDETEATWEYIQPGEEPYKPYSTEPANPDPNRRPTKYWMIDGRRQMRITRDDARTHTTTGMRELLDVPERLRKMDELGVDVHVLYPTTFLVEGTDKPEVELAIRRSYNRWLADRTKESGGRLRWVCLPPTRSMDKAVEELRFARDHGACGVLKKGNQEADRWPSDEYFFPLYKEAEKLDMPICCHTGSGVPDWTPAREFTLSAFMRMEMSVPNAFESYIRFGVTKQFPRLRFGFVEAGASWVPHVIYYMKRRLEKLGEGTFGRQNNYELGDSVLKQHRMYVTCQVDEDLPYIIQHTGEDNMVTGSDFSHADSAMEIHFQDALRRRVEAGELTDTQVRKITQDNPKAFYGL